MGRTIVVVAALLVRRGAACLCGPGNLTWSDTKPNLLVVGDSISAVGTGYVEELTAVLGGLAHVVHAGTVADNGRRLRGAGVDGAASALGHKGPCGTSFGVLECVDSWVGARPWDVISLNWGLHDICPKLYAPVSRTEYAENLRAIVAKLGRGLAPGGRIVWVSTTPVPASYPSRNDSDVVALNAIAADLVAHDPAFDRVVFGADLYSDVVARCDANATWAGYPATNDCLYLQDNGVHFSALGRRFTALDVAAHLLPFL